MATMDDGWVDVPEDEWVDAPETGTPAAGPTVAPTSTPTPAAPLKPRTAFDMLTAPFDPRKLEPLAAGFAGSAAFEGLPILGGAYRSAKESAQTLLGLTPEAPKPGEEGLSPYERGRRETLGYLQRQEATDPERFRGGQYLGILGPMAASMGLGGVARAAAAEAPAVATGLGKALKLAGGVVRSGAEGAASAAAPAALSELSQGKSLGEAGQAALDASKLGGGVGLGVPLVGMAAGATARKLGQVSREMAPGLAVKGSGAIQKHINKHFQGEEERVREAGEWALSKPEMLPGLAPSKTAIGDAASTVRQSSGAQVGASLRASTVAPTYEKVKGDATQLWQSLTNAQREYMGPEFTRLEKITDNLYGVKQVPTAKAREAADTLRGLMDEQKALVDQVRAAKVAEQQIKSYKAAGVPVPADIRQQAAGLPVLKRRQAETGDAIKGIKSQKAPDGRSVLDETAPQPTKQPDLQEFNAEKSDIDGKTNFGASNQDEASANAIRMMYGNQVMRKNVYEAAEQGLDPQAFQTFRTAMNDYGHATTFEQLAKAGYARESGNDVLGLVAKMTAASGPVAALATGDVKPLLGSLLTAGALKFYNDRGAGTAAKLLSKTGRLLTPEKLNEIRHSARLLGQYTNRAAPRAMLLPRYGEEPGGLVPNY